MLFDPKVVAFAIAFIVASVTSAFLSLVANVPSMAFVVVIILAFSSTFVLCMYSLKFFVMRELNNVYVALEKIKKKDFKLMRKQIPTLSPIQKLNYELYNYASKKQKEIDHLKQLETYRREFLADVSHELKTPIFAAQGFLHTLLDGALEDPDVNHKFLNKAAKSLDGLHRLVEDLLVLSKMEAGFIKMQMQEFDIQDLIQEVFEQVEDLAEDKNIILKFRKPILQESFDTTIKADTSRIRQVILNLVENAIKYGQEGGFVKVYLENYDTQIRVFVEDNGLGIPSEHIERIFERFYRVEKSRAKHKGGSGLGLAIVKHILEAHESEIQVKSRAKKGTTFNFLLPKPIQVNQIEKNLEEKLQKL